MKKVIEKKSYNTETATLVAEYWNGLASNDFRHLTEDLYLTEKGQWFLHGSGGAMTKYSESNGNSTWGSSDIILLTASEAYNWIERYQGDVKDANEIIEKYFGNEIEEG
ncbi:MAG: hypothetical protein R6W78_10470 [Bacteroidales bacterium]